MRVHVAIAAIALGALPAVVGTDGEAVAFLPFRDREGLVRIARVTSDGARLVDLRSRTYYRGSRRGDTLPSVSPDGARVAFVRDRQLWVVDRTTGFATRVTDAGRPSDERFTEIMVLIAGWSPDGRRVLYSVHPSESESCEGPRLEAPPGDYGLFAFDVEAGSSAPVPVRERFVQSLGDDELLVATEDDRLAVERPSDGSMRWITRQGRGYMHAEADPGGREIAAIEHRAMGRDSRVVRIDVRSGAVTSVTEQGAWAEFQWPRWSPSGERIAHERHVPRTSRTMLVVEGTTVAQCDLSLLRYEWVGEQHLVLVCGETLRLVDLEGAVVWSAAIESLEVESRP